MGSVHECVESSLLRHAMRAVNGMRSRHESIFVRGACLKACLSVCVYDVFVSFCVWIELFLPLRANVSVCHIADRRSRHVCHVRAPGAIPCGGIGISISTDRPTRHTCSRTCFHRERLLFSQRSTNARPLDIGQILRECGKKELNS